MSVDEIIKLIEKRETKKVLEKITANPSIIYSKGYADLTILHSAVSWNNKEIFNSVIAMIGKQTGHLNCIDKFGWTPLMHACYGGHCDIYKTLLSKKADVNILDKEGMNALMIVCKHSDQPSIIKDLLAADSKTDIKSTGKYDDGSTALMLASKNNRNATVKILMEHKVLS